MDSLPNPIILLAALGGMSVLPFVAIMVSSFIKIVVVMYILRNALGLQQVPPNLAVNGLAILLSIFVMAPIGYDMYQRFNSHNIEISNLRDPGIRVALEDSFEPMREFLGKHSDKHEREFFADSANQLWQKHETKPFDENSVLVLIPSFTTSQLTEAFKIGFLIYLPFVIIDLVVSNILLSMGMIMVSPIMISIPFKVLLFVMADGWTRLVHGLVVSYF